MADPFLQRRPRLAYPFTILTSPNTVRLVAGEDFRYTLTAPELDRWLPPLLERFLGKETLQTLFAALTPPQRDAALQVIQHLYGERVLIEGSANDAHAAKKYHLVVEGSGGLGVRKLPDVGHLANFSRERRGRPRVQVPDRLDVVHLVLEKGHRRSDVQLADDERMAALLEGPLSRN